MPLDRHSADDAGANVEPIGIRVLRKWERAQKGLDPASAAILNDLISVATKGVAEARQSKIAERTGVGIATVRRRLALLAHLGLISRKERFRSNGRRRCDEIRLITERVVVLKPEQRDGLIRRFNRRDAIAARSTLSTPKTDAVSTGAMTHGEHALSHGFSSLSPVSGSEQAQNLRAVGEPSGCHASATPPIAEPGDPVFSMEVARPSSTGIGDDDFEDAGSMYGDGEGGTLTDGSEFDIEERPEPHRQAASPVTAEPGSYGPDELPPGLHLSPVEQHRAARAWARGERYTPPRPRSQPMAPVEPEAPADRREHHTRLWCDLLPRIAEMTAKNGIVMSNAALRSRLGKLIKEHGAFEASKLVTHCLDAEPGGDPLTYVEGIRRGQHDEEERGRRGMTDEIDYR
ncbi:hypothetical protein OKC48_11220 [Methylorubrum extorquens]|uniref:hypothetical protein n=1 Tax=Methylorubrum extorquens TaxID=408 RepID=UPI002238CEAB|nr:hypothetical protein [Methylorubrum extorquens]UYW29040.1 hypothetical protein OKC48_11220 [Methylorubrum extorquens]